MINFEYLYKAGLTDSDYILLIKVLQKEVDLISKDDTDRINELLEEGYFTLLKTGKTIRERLRISPKGKAFLENLDKPLVTDEVILVEEKLKELYEERGNGTGKNFRERLAWFMNETGFSPKAIIQTVENHLHADSFTYALHNLIWKQPNVFATRPSLEESPLYEMICRDYKFNKTVYSDKKDKELHYLFQYGRVAPPKGLRKELYFTGSYETDFDHFVNLAEELTKKVIK